MTRKTRKTLNDPTLDEPAMFPRSVGWALTEENYPSLARFRFPGIEAPPSEKPPAVPRTRFDPDRGADAATRKREAVTLDPKTVARLRRKARRAKKEPTP